MTLITKMLTIPYHLNVPVKPFVLKYLISRFRPEQGVWVINKNERIGKVLYSLLEHMPSNFNKKQPELGAWMRIGICLEYAERRGLYLSNASILEFNDFVQMELIEQIAMYTFQVRNRIGLKKYKELYVRHNRSKSAKVHVVQDPDLFQYFEKKEIIYDILRLYDISEDDFPFETMYKACQRLKLPLLSA